MSLQVPVKLWFKNVSIAREIIEIYKKKSSCNENTIFCYKYEIITKKIVLESSYAFQTIITYCKKKSKKYTQEYKQKIH